MLVTSGSGCKWSKRRLLWKRLVSLQIAVMTSLQAFLLTSVDMLSMIMTL
ncbi:hypothetical protein LOK49_LG07G00793 [Camellia lanceoleosa]|uniref:Uncharacterized protein n=1 Tax=Camellia lanceoleosa TaxID=1840588 RepID=A0ACC0H4E5_9ERIC|nr:hypothetical protein LOK49_LG07G00793 [Camellia lanceoleosa]